MCVCVCAGIFVCASRFLYGTSAAAVRPRRGKTYHLSLDIIYTAILYYIMFLFSVELINFRQILFSPAGRIPRDIRKR